MATTTANEEDDCDNRHSATTFSNHTLQHERTHTLIFKGGSFAITHHHHSQFATTTTWHPPQTITTLDMSTLLVFKGGDCLRAPAPPTTLEHEHVCSFSRVVA